MNTDTPCFHALIENDLVICGQAIINGEMSWIVNDRQSRRWYEAIRTDVLRGTRSYIRIQEVFWNKQLGGFFA